MAPVKPIGTEDMPSTTKQPVQAPPNQAPPAPAQPSAPSPDQKPSGA